MNADERDKLMDLHRAAMNACDEYMVGNATVSEMTEADDAFRDFLYSLDVTE